MSLFEAIILGIVQGLTEFLPISSSGHLVLFEEIFNLDVENLKAFDVMVHVGTLFAIIVYFWKDIIWLLTSLLSYVGLMKKNSKRKQGQFVIEMLIIATIPAVIIGVFFGDAIDYFFRDPLYIGLFMIVIAQIFFITEHFYKKNQKKLTKNIEELGYSKALYIGLAQALALIPGVSRSGITISTGMMNSLERSQAARFSFLMGVPAILGAGLFTAVKVLKSGDATTLITPEYIAGFLSAAISGYFAIYFLMRFLKKHSLFAFGVYLLIVGIITIILNFA